MVSRLKLLSRQAWEIVIFLTACFLFVDTKQNATMMFSDKKEPPQKMDGPSRLQVLPMTMIAWEWFPILQDVVSTRFPARTENQTLVATGKENTIATSTTTRSFTLTTEPLQVKHREQNTPRPFSSFRSPKTPSSLRSLRSSWSFRLFWTKRLLPLVSLPIRIVVVVVRVLSLYDQRHEWNLPSRHSNPFYDTVVLPKEAVVPLRGQWARNRVRPSPWMSMMRSFCIHQGEGPILMNSNCRQRYGSHGC